MSEWKETTLGKEVNLITGFPFKSSQYTNNLQDTRLLRGDNIVQGKLRWDGVKRWSSDDSTIDPIYQLREGDVVLAMDRPWIEAGLKFSVISRFDIPSLLVQRVACIRSGDRIKKDFLRYLIASKEFTQHILSVETGTAVPHISPSQIKEFSFKLPEVIEQQAIATVLSSLDDKIDLLHRQNKTLEAMAETLFRQWFIEEASEDWEEVPLGNFFEISSGKGLKKEQLVENGAYSVFGANGEIGRTNDFLFNEKLLFTGRVGTLGNIFIIDKEKIWLSDNTLVFRNVKYFYFVYFVLKTARLGDYNAGSTQPLIRQSDIKEIPINSPNGEILEKFEMLSIRMFEKIKTNKKQIKTLEKLRDNLLPKLMSGEVRVRF
ncbi:MAG: restriction endonuclease subunit S [Methylococcaceae bacterium]